MKTSRFSETQILGILKQGEGGLPVPELFLYCCRRSREIGECHAIVMRLGHASVSDANWPDQRANGTKPLE